MAKEERLCLILLPFCISEWGFKFVVAVMFIVRGRDREK